MHLDRVYALIAQALQLGATRLSAYVVHWDISGDCTDPFHTELWGRPSAPHGQRTLIVRPFVENTPQILEIETRCRKCDRCLRSRQRRWYGAAIREVAWAPRTWFGTLTLSPDSHHVMLERARFKLGVQGVDFERLSAHDQFVARHLAIGKELTKYIKRVRKNSGAALRYLLVAEAHKSGLPHYHMLVHETADSGPVRHRHLSEAWSLGFESWRLSDPPKTGNPAYLCKYLSKSLSARVRASQGYGGAASDTHANVIRTLEVLVGEPERRARAVPEAPRPHLNEATE